MIEISIYLFIFIITLCAVMVVYITISRHTISLNQKDLELLNNRIKLLNETVDTYSEDEYLVKRMKLMARNIFNDNTIIGFWGDNPQHTAMLRNHGEIIALIHSKLSNGLEALREDKADEHLKQYKGIEVELANVLIRIFEYAYAFKYDIFNAMLDKIEFNKTRDYKHGKNF